MKYLERTMLLKSFDILGTNTKKHQIYRDTPRDEVETVRDNDFFLEVLRIAPLDETRFRTLISVYESQTFRTLHVDGGGAGDLKGGYLRHITNR